MKDMPQSAIEPYEYWIRQYPESWHPSDLERFYLFVGVLLSVSKKQRSRDWLKENLKQDCPKLSDEDIEQYCDMYEHVRDYEKALKGGEAKLIAASRLQAIHDRARVESDIRDIGTSDVSKSNQ